MAMFFDFPVSAPDAYTPITSEWHSAHPVLAVASKESHGSRSSGSVNLFNDDGDHLFQSTIQRSASPTVIAWHPTKKLLATGWESGEVIMWNEETQSLYEGQTVHEGHITALTWSYDGSRLFSADEDGVLAVWRISKTGKASITNTLKIDSGITHCTAACNATGDASIMFFSSHEGVVYQGDATGTFETVLNGEHSVVQLIYDHESSSLIIGTANMMITHHHVSPEGKLENNYEFKLSGKELMCAAFAEPGVLVAATNQNLIRVWCSEEGDSYYLGLTDESGDFSQSDVIVHIAYNRSNKVIAAASLNGLIYMWKLNNVACNENSCWSFLPPIELSGTMKSVTWGPNNLMAVQNSVDTVSILREHIIRKSYNKGVAVVQVSSTRAVVEVLNKQSSDVDVEFKISGVHTDGNCVVLWSGKVVAVYEVVKTSSIVRKSGEFKCAATSCVVVDSSVFTAEGSNIHVRTLQGTSKQILSFSEDQEVLSLAANSTFVAACSHEGQIVVYDISKRTAKLFGGPRNVSDDVDAITSLAINATGNCVSFTAAVEGKSDPNIWVWSVDSDSVICKAFGVGGRVPSAHCWDSSDGRVLACETKLHAPKDGSVQTQVSTLFLTPDSTIIEQGTDNITDTTYGPFIGIDIPSMFFALKGKNDDGMLLHKHTMADFVGLENVDADTKRSMLEFSYQLTVGDLDLALNSVRGISNTAIWHNMARMCVLTKRLDVAAVCMGKLGDAVAARVLREAANEGEVNARVGALATQLEMYEEAKKLYSECGRYDLVNTLLQSQGRWEDAFAVAEEHDRVNLKSTFYNFAKECEQLGETDEAIKYFELSNTHAYEVPRVLFQHIDELDVYVTKSKSKTLYKWWAQYLESTEEYQKALEFYNAAGDVLSAVRIHCFLDRIDAAKELVDKTGDKAAAYHLAKQYESIENIDEAITLFSTAGSFNNAIRLAREFGRKKEMLSLALKSSKSDMLSAAEFYENEGQYDKAVTLYHKSGRTAKALEMCFAHSLHGALSEVTQNLDDTADPHLVEKASDYFLQNGQFERAVKLLIISRKYEEALGLIEEHNIFLSDEYAEKMTYKKGEVDKGVRTALLSRIATICFDQGSYQLATRKYTQAGQHVQAMKALLKCGDTNKIIFFANKCRTKEVYVLAANYLQSLNWRTDTEIMDHIVTFYKKGKALDTLSAFFESCAAMEVDDYQNYEKALEALNESLRYLSKARMKDINEQETRVATLQFKIDSTQKFLEMKNSEGEAMVTQAHGLLQEQNINDAVRIGDIYSMLIDFYASARRFQEAYDMLQEFRNRAPQTNIAYFVSMKVVEDIHKQLNIPLGRGQGDGEDDGNEIGEDIDGEDV
eukprot:m.57093 g.57093  ORF g.57093 m.57093 type:complete len:1349 (+) comp11214_c0_seq1:56-4102(+)